MTEREREREKTLFGSQFILMLSSAAATITATVAAPVAEIVNTLPQNMNFYKDIKQ
jgi:hypothetical protein